MHKADFLRVPGVTKERLDDSIEHRDCKFQSLAGPHSLARKHPANRHHPVFFLKTGTLGVGVQAMDWINTSIAFRTVGGSKPLLPQDAKRLSHNLKLIAVTLVNLSPGGFH